MGIFSDIINSVFKTITKLSRPYFTLEENDLKFKIDSDNFYLFPISNIETKTRHDPYVLDAYTMTANGLYIEYIHTDSDVSWNGQAFSFFISLLRHDLKANEMKLLEKKELKHYEFLVYEVDESYILNIIYIYEMNKDVFIIDLKGELYENLLRNFHRDYVYKFKKNDGIFPYINTSLVKNNAIYSYFHTGSAN